VRQFLLYLKTVTDMSSVAISIRFLS